MLPFKRVSFLFFFSFKQVSNQIFYKPISHVETIMKHLSLPVLKIGYHLGTTWLYFTTTYCIRTVMESLNLIVVGTVVKIQQPLNHQIKKGLEFLKKNHQLCLYFSPRLFSTQFSIVCLFLNHRGAILKLPWRLQCISKKVNGFSVEQYIVKMWTHWWQNKVFVFILMCVLWPHPLIY